MVIDFDLEGWPWSTSGCYFPWSLPVPVMPLSHFLLWLFPFGLCLYFESESSMVDLVYSGMHTCMYVCIYTHVCLLDYVMYMYTYVFNFECRHVLTIVMFTQVFFVLLLTRRWLTEMNWCYEKLNHWVPCCWPTCFPVYGWCLDMASCIGHVIGSSHVHLPFLEIILCLNSKL